MGCAMPEAEQGMNVARIASLRAGLPVEISAMTINRFCSSGLQAIAMAAERIMAGGAEVIVAGGLESMTMIPMGGHKLSANPWLVDHYPDAYLSMGLTAENLAKRFGITREQADEFSLRSHQKALAAIAAGKFDDEIVPVPVSFTTANGSKPKRVDIIFKTDEGPRADTSLEALAQLKPAFHVQRHGHGGQCLADVGRSGGGGGDVHRKGQAAGIQPLARYVAFATAGYKPEEMGLGPVFAIPKALKMAGLDAGADRSHRTERGLRLPVAGGDSGSRAGPGEGESQRRGGGAGASAGLHRSQAHGNAVARAEAEKRRATGW